MFKYNVSQLSIVNSWNTVHIVAWKFFRLWIHICQIGRGYLKVIMQIAFLFSLLKMFEIILFINTGMPCYIMHSSRRKACCFMWVLPFFIFFCLGIIVYIYFCILLLKSIAFKSMHVYVFPMVSALKLILIWEYNLCHRVW